MKAKLRFALRCLVSAALLFLVARKLDWHDLGVVLSRIDWIWALAAFLLTGILIAGLAWRWAIFLAQQLIDLSFARILSLTWAGQFFNSLLPGSTGGDVFKIYQLCRLFPERKAAAVASVLVDRLSALIALLALAAAAFLLEPAPLRILFGDYVPAIKPWWIIAFFIVAVTTSWFLFRAIVARGGTGRLVRTLRAALGSLRPNSAVAFAVTLAFAIHLLNFLSVFFLARSLGVAITYFEILLMMPVVLLLVMLPITINGHGLRELLLITYFTQLGLHIGERGDIAYKEVAVALSLLMVANDLLWSLPGGLQYLGRFRLGAQPRLATGAIQ